MRIRISITVEGQTRSIEVNSPDSVELVKETLYQALENNLFVKIPYTDTIYRCETIERVSVQEW